MLDSPRTFHLIKFVLPAILVLWLLSRLWGEQSQSQYASLFRPVRTEKNAFVESFLKHEIDGELDGSSIQELCTNRLWTPGLLLSCDAVPGGLAEVKSGVLTCVRVAIEMGAELIIPEIVERSVVDPALAVPHDVGPRRGTTLDYMFDHDFFNETLAKYCPQMRVHESLNVFYDNPSVLAAAALDIFQVPDVKMVPNIPNGGKHDIHVLMEPEKLGERIHRWLDSIVLPQDRRYPYRVNLRPTFKFMFPTAMTSPQLWRSLGRILRVRPDLQRLAGAALFNLHTVFNLTGLDPSRGIPAAHDPTASFAAIELRTDRDVWRSSFPSYDVQASDALSFLMANNMTRVFLADGATADNTTHFVERCLDFGVSVVTKEDLLEGEDAAALKTLSLDQRRLVDYEIVLRAGLFSGSAYSPFAWNVAMRRLNAYGAPGQPANTQHLNNGTVRWHDQYSTIYGKYDIGEHYLRTVWP